MPELPDLVYIEKKLNAILPSKIIERVDIREPIVLRPLIATPFVDALKSRTFQNIYRHGPFLIFVFDNSLEMVIHFMLTGKLKLTSQKEKPGRDLCFSLFLQDESAMHYLDDKKMGKVYLVDSGERLQIPMFQQQGVDILSAEFTQKCFQKLIKKQRKQIRVFLMDQHFLSAIGNAYADEILFDAKIHPKTFCYQLPPEKIEHLYESIRKVMAWGISEIEKADQPIEVKVREHMKVRNRRNQPCPRCGTTIRRAGVLGYDAFFCPKCQMPKRSQFIDWS